MTANEFWQHIKKDAPSVASFVRRKKLFKLLRVVLINAVLILLAWFTVDQMNQPSLRMPTFIGVACICLFLTWTSKPKGLIFSKPYIGTIEKASVETLMKVGTGNGKYGMSPMTANFWVLTVRCDDGNVRRIELASRYASCYRVGDRIAVLPSIAYPFLLDIPDDRPAVCWWCGSINRPSERECLNCGRDHVN